MDDAVKKLQERMEEINRGFEEGDIHRRYREQINVTRKLVKKVKNKHRKLSQQDVDDEDLKEFRVWVESVETALNFLLEKAESEDEEMERIISKFGEDFYVKTSSPEVGPPLIVADDNLDADSGRFHPLFEIDLSSRNGIKFEKQKKVPFIQLPQEWCEDVEKWMLSLHEFSHVLYDYSDHLNYGEGRHAHKAEFFADLLAAEIAGPGYIYSVYNILDGNKDLEQTKKTHPAWTSRLKAINDCIESFVDNDISQQYQEIMESIGEVESVTLEVKETEALRAAERRLEDRFRDKSVTGFTDKWEELFNSEDSNSPITMVASFILPESENQFANKQQLKRKIEAW